MLLLTAKCKVVVTADQGIRGGKVIELKATVDEAVTNCDCVQNVFVMNRTGAQVPWQPRRDVKLEVSLINYCRPLNFKPAQTVRPSFVKSTHLPPCN